MNEKPTIGDGDIQQWSRHYDSIVWTVNSIFIAVIGALLVYVYSERSPTPVASILGLSLILFVLFYISGFRKFRANLHRKITNAALRAFLTNPYEDRGLKQWDLYAVYMFAVSIAFVYRLFTTLEGPYISYVGLAILMSLVIWGLWKRGKSEGDLKASSGPGSIGS